MEKEILTDGSIKSFTTGKTWCQEAHLAGRGQVKEERYSQVSCVSLIVTKSCRRMRTEAGPVGCESPRKSKRRQTKNSPEDQTDLKKRD